MNWAAAAAIISGITLLLVLFGGAVLWGKLTEKVEGHDRRLDSHKAEIFEINNRLIAHDVDIGRLKEWKDGFNAGVGVRQHVEMAQQGS